MSLSVCTLGHGRANHLTNLVEGLRRQVEPPAELVIGVMQATLYDLPQTDFPIRQIRLEGGRLALAAARNAAAAAAAGDMIAFLDIDCIPAPEFVRDYRLGLEIGEALLMGEVMYLPAGATAGGVDYGRFAEVAVRHTERAGPPEEALGACEDYRCFWSLNFALHRSLSTVSGVSTKVTWATAGRIQTSAAPSLRAGA